MSARIHAPLSQRRHTNVAAVRYTRNGVKLEIACYKNKVISYRSGVETHLDEVLQVERVFTNISRGFYASEKEIKVVFGREITEKDALRYILDHGELQVAQQERVAEVDQMFIDIAVIISQKCVNKVTQRPFPAHVIEQALRSVGAAVKLDQPVKKQALALINRLIDSQVIPISRARMKLRCNTEDEASFVKLVEWCESNGASILEKIVSVDEADTSGQKHSLLILLQPNLFRDIERFVKKGIQPGGTVHIVESSAVDVGETGLMDSEMIARVNADVNVLGGEEEIGANHYTCSSSSNAHDQGKQQGGAGKKGGKKNHGSQCLSAKEADDVEGRCTSLGTDPSLTAPVQFDEASDELQQMLSKLGLDNKCGAGSDHDDDAGGKGRSGKKKTKRRQDGPKQPSTVQQGGKNEDCGGSDDELLVNRKQRKQAAVVKSKGGETNHDWSEDEYKYDYGEDGENEE